jgi:hypothetical protein
MEKEKLYDEVYNRLPWNSDRNIMERAMQKTALYVVETLMETIYNEWYDSTNGVYEHLEEVKAQIQNDISAWKTE